MTAVRREMSLSAIEQAAEGSRKGRGRCACSDKTPEKKKVVATRTRTRYYVK